MPAEFIPLAEDTGQIVRIGRAVLQQACSDAAVWAQELTTVLTVHVNVSARQLQEPGLVEDVARQLEAHQLHPSHIALEITESMLVAAGSTAMATLGDLGQLGVPVVLDDFGTGYSSLAYLDQLDIDMIKIDRPLISGDVRKRRIVQAIIALGQSLDLAIVAEGIEHPVDAAWVRKAGCTYAQGYLFGHPSPARVISDLATDRMMTAATFDRTGQPQRAHRDRPADGHDSPVPVRLPELRPGTGQFLATDIPVPDSRRPPLSS